MTARRHRGVAAPPEHEITAEIADEVDDNGEVHTVADPEDIKREGALNAEAAQNNRRRKAVENKKRGGTGAVPWNEARATLLYDDILNLYPANTLMIYVERLSGTPASWYLMGMPKSGHELYQSIIKQCHGRREETEYRVVFRDQQRKFDRGIGRITIPSTMDDASMASAQGMPMPNGIPSGGAFPSSNSYGGQQQQPQQQQPPQFAQQPGYQQQQPQYPQQQQPQQQYPQQPQMMPMYPTQDLALLEIQRQIAEMNGRVTAYLQQPQQPQQAPQHHHHHPPPMERQPRFNGSVVPPAPQAQQAAPQQQQPHRPAFVPPPGYIIVVQPDGQQMLAPAAQFGLAAPAAAAPAAPPQPPPRPQTASEQFRDAIGLITTAADAVGSMQSTLRNAAGALGVTAAAASAVAEKDDGDDLPFKKINYGEYSTVVNKEDGSMRIGETVAANLPSILNFLDKTAQKIQQANQMQQMPQAPSQNGMMPMPQVPR